MRRNNENAYSFIQAIHKEILDLKATVAEMLLKMNNISQQVQRATFSTLMQGPDISDFFPVYRAEQLQLFMDKTHPEWPARRLEFYNFLFSTVTDSPKTFTKGVLKALFSRKYMLTVKWPGYG